MESSLESIVNSSALFQSGVSCILLIVIDTVIRGFWLDSRLLGNDTKLRGRRGWRIMMAVLLCTGL
jgi:hypothetical protein